MTSRGVTVGTRLRRLSSLLRWRPRVGKLPGMHGQSRSRRLWRLRKLPGVLFCGVRVVRGLIVLSTLIAPAKAADEPDLIFRRSTVFKLLTPNDKLATYGLDDPEVEGVACHFTVPERGGVKGWLGVAEEVSDISLACRQIGPIRFKAKFEQGEDVFRKRRSLFFKKMQIVRGCDAKRNVLVYMVYSDRLIEGSPKNSTSSVPIMPWGQNDQIQKCADFLEK
jgi:CreA protein